MTSPDETRPPPAPMTVTDAGEDSEANSSTSADIESGLSAWFCVVGSFIFLVPSFGLMQSIGTFQSYLQLNQLSDHTLGEVGWITGMFMFLGLFLSIHVGPVLDHYGPRVLGIFGAGMTVAMFFIVAECKTYWQFMLGFGVFGGIGSAITGLVAVAVVGKLFVRRLGLAMGIALAGSAVGSIIFPIMLRSLLPKLGWRWSMRILGFFIAGIMIPGVFCFFPYPRLLAAISPNGQQRRDRAVLNLAAFRSPAFSFITAGLFTLEFVLFAISGLLPTIATSAGLTPEDGYTLIAIMGGTSVFGRVLVGVIGDRIGHFNALILTVIASLLIMGTMFVPFGTKIAGVLYTFSALWGFCSGSFLSATPVCMSKTCEPKDYGRYYGTMNSVLSFALLLSLPLCGLMIENMGAQALAGLLIAIVFLGGGCYFAARALLIGEWFALKTKI
ncbi:Fc.00g002360.m01.CDS01 [Cosmosporella sp. VM-42]